MISKKILLIEDDEDLAQLFADALVRDGYSVDKFIDPLEACSIFEQNPQKYDLILSDIRMPGMSGLDLVRKIKKINARVNVALMSAFETDNFQSDLKELNLDTFLKKPIHIEQLINAVKECVAKKVR